MLQQQQHQQHKTVTTIYTVLKDEETDPGDFYYQASW